MLIIDMSEIKLPGEAKLNNLPPECGQPIDAGDDVWGVEIAFIVVDKNRVFV
jgi:hypothetical protein